MNSRGMLTLAVLGLMACAMVTARPPRGARLHAYAIVQPNKLDLSF